MMMLFDVDSFCSVDVLMYFMLFWFYCWWVWIYDFFVIVMCGGVIGVVCVSDVVMWWWLLRLDGIFFKWKLVKFVFGDVCVVILGVWSVWIESMCDVVLNGVLNSVLMCVWMMEMGIEVGKFELFEFVWWSVDVVCVMCGGESDMSVLVWSDLKCSVGVLVCVVCVWLELFEVLMGMLWVGMSVLMCGGVVVMKYLF